MVVGNVKPRQVTQDLRELKKDVERATDLKLFYSMVTCIIQHASTRQRMSRTADSEAHIETFMEAGNSLPQQPNEMHHNEMRPDDESGDGVREDLKPLHRRPPDPRERLPWWRLAFK
jgi:hypothetical protein